MLSAASYGFATGLSLIVAIGAQNAFVLRQGLRLEHVAAVVGVCTVSDVVLIAAGVLGLMSPEHLGPLAEMALKAIARPPTKTKANGPGLGHLNTAAAVAAAAHNPVMGA